MPIVVTSVEICGNEIAIYHPLLTGIEAAGGRIEEIPVGMRVRNKNLEETAVKFSGANRQWFVNL